MELEYAISDYYDLVSPRIESQNQSMEERSNKRKSPSNGQALRPAKKRKTLMHYKERKTDPDIWQGPNVILRSWSKMTETGQAIGKPHTKPGVLLPEWRELVKVDTHNSSSSHVILPSGSSVEGPLCKSLEVKDNTHSLGKESRNTREGINHYFGETLNKGTAMCKPSDQHVQRCGMNDGLHLSIKNPTKNNRKPVARPKRNRNDPASAVKILIG